MQKEAVYDLQNLPEAGPGTVSIANFNHYHCWRILFTGKMGRFLVLFLVSIYSISCNRQGGAEYPTGPTPANPAYVGDKACLACHTAQYNDWRGSHHDRAMQRPNDSTVLGDFNNASFTADGDTFFFYRQDTAFYVRTNIAGREHAFNIAYTFGVTPLQQYLIRFPDGKYQVLRASWDTVEKKWFNQYAGQGIAANDWLHWTGGGQRWNTMCAECHSTNLQKNYDLRADTFNTTYAAVNVSCEACHGPGRQHVNWAGSSNPVGDPQVKVLGWERSAQFNQCAGCHARRVKLTPVMRPDVAFDDQFRLQTISSEYYYADGQVRDEDYVFGSFVQSKMFHNNVRCTNCHKPHSLKLHYKGNLLCLQCHAVTYDSPDHHFHAQDSEAAQCVSCHMTGKVYMGNDFRRDHSFRVPRPDQSVQYGTPNACTGCHRDMQDQWAAGWIEQWYGKERPEHFSGHLLKAANPPYDEETRQEVVQFIQQLQYPAIARATALEYYPLVGDEADYSMLLAALEDSAALVRANALQKFQPFPMDQRASLAVKFVDDQARVVRIAAARLMADVSLDGLPTGERGQALRARAELEAMLRANADFPLGRLQLGDYYFRQDKNAQAVKEYEKALQMDSLLTPVYPNLATAYSIAGRNDRALATLNRLVLLAPAYGRGYYLRGLLQYEMGKVDEAIADMEKAINLAPANFRAYYNLANLYYIRGDLLQAGQTLETGLQLQPGSAEGRQLLAIIKAKASGK